MMWILKLVEYNVDIQYLAHSENAVTGALSYNWQEFLEWLKLLKFVPGHCCLISREQLIEE